MTIKEDSEKYNISQDTLRYYERVKMIRWVELAICMRNSGLPVEAMIEYLALFQKGDETIPARLELLNSQMEVLARQKEQIEETMGRLSYKIERYEEAIKTGKLTWTKKGEIL